MSTLVPSKDTPDLTPASPNEEGKLMRELRGERSYREFAAYINKKIPAGMPGKTTHASIYQWENGIHNVTDSCLLAWTMFYPKTDERNKLAQAIIKLRHRSYEKIDPAELDKENGEKLLEKVVKS